MNDLARICAGSKHKRPSVQSDKVPISQSCDSDFLSVCQTATEGLSIQTHAHILPIPSNANSHGQWRTVKTTVPTLLAKPVCSDNFSV